MYVYIYIYIYIKYYRTVRSYGDLGCSGAGFELSNSKTLAFLENAAPVPPNARKRCASGPERSKTLRRWPRTLRKRCAGGPEWSKTLRRCPRTLENAALLPPNARKRCAGAPERSNTLRRCLFRKRKTLRLRHRTRENDASMNTRANTGKLPLAPLNARKRCRSFSTSAQTSCVEIAVRKHRSQKLVSVHLNLLLYILCL